MRIPESSFLIAALALHAALPVIAHVVPHMEQPLVARSWHERTEIEIEVTPVEPLPQAEARLEPQRTVNERRPEVSPEARAAVRDPYAEVTPPSPTSTASPEAQPPPSSTSPTPAPSDTFDPVVPDAPRGPGGLMVGPPGIGGQPVWSIPGVVTASPGGPPAPTAPPAPREVDPNIAGKVLTAEQKKKDRALGLNLPAAGTVASALGDAVRGEDTPNEGRASFVVRIGPNGQILDVRVATTSAGSVSVWERAARAAASRLRGKALTLTSEYAKGATVYVDVSSAMLMPDGTKTGGLQRQGAGASFDLSNLGAKPRRSVRTSFTVVASK